MIEKQTVIDQIEVARNGHVQIRFGLLLVEDGQEIGCQWHRTAIEPGGDVDAAIAAVNADITTRESLRASLVNDDKVPLLKAICGVAHTPDVVEKHREKIAKAQADRDRITKAHDDFVANNASKKK